MSPISRTPASSTAQSGAAARTRSRNSSTAEQRTISAAEALPSGTASGLMRSTASAEMCSGSRLVTSTRSEPALDVSVSTRLATRSTMCSALSSTSRQRDVANASPMRSMAGTPDVSRPSSAASAISMSSRVDARASSTNSTRSCARLRTPCATRTARLVLPMPPAPTSVMTGVRSSMSTICAISASRPTSGASSDDAQASGSAATADGTETAGASAAGTRSGPGDALATSR